jgi:hypothetical protein
MPGQRETVLENRLTISIRPVRVWGQVSALNCDGRTIWIVDVHGYGKRFIVRADEKLTAFRGMERAIHEFAVSLTL